MASGNLNGQTATAGADTPSLLELVSDVNTTGISPIYAAATAYADAAFTGAASHIANLGTIGEQIANFPEIEVDLNPVAPALEAFVLPALPVRPPGMELNVPAAPATPALTGVDLPVAPAAPVFDAVMPLVDLALTAPQPVNLLMPAVPGLQATVLPEAPAVPALEAIALLDVMDLPVFDAVRPAIDLDIERPALAALLPAAPEIVELALPEAPEALLVGAVAAYVPGAAPVLTVAPPDIDLDIARPGAFAGVLPVAPVIADIVMPEAPEALAVGAVAPLVVGAAPELLAELPAIDLDIARPLTYAPVLPEAPVVRDLDIPAAPDDAVLKELEPLAIGAAPEFDAVAPAIDLDIAKPAALAAVVPVRPALEATVIPAAADPVLPDVPSLAELAIPAAPELALPDFDAVLGDAPTVPAVAFAWTEDSYTSGLLTDLRNTLQTWVNGASTGLAPAVEEGIWNRMRDRDQRAAAQETEDLLRGFSIRGFSRPPGALSTALQRAQQTLIDKQVSASREIAIEQARLEQSNRQFAFTTAFNVETTLIQYASQIAGRALDAAKFAASIGLDIFRSEVLRYQAEIQAFTARAEVYRARLAGELAKLDIFRAQIEAQRLVGELNQQQIQLYTARVGAAQALIEMFRARIQAAQAHAEVQRTVIQAYAAEVGAYGEQVRAKASEYDAYATQVRAEVSKVETFKVQADAFSARVQGFSALLNARSAEKQSEIDIRQRLPLEAFKARTEAFRNTIAGLTAASEVDRTRVQAYSAQVSAQETLIRASAQGVEVFKATIEAERSKADTYRLQVDAFGRRVEAFRVATQAAIDVKKMDIELATDVPIKVSQARTALYEAMVRAASATAEVERTRVQAYSAEIEGYGRQIQAAGLEVDIFKAVIDGEKGKAEVYRTQVEAFGRQVDAFGRQTDADIAAKKLDIQLATEVPIEVNKARIALYEAGVRASQALADVQRTRVEAYRAEVGAYGEQVRARGVEVDAYGRAIEAEKSKADIYRIDTDAYKARVDAFDALMRASIAGKTSEIEIKQRLPLELLRTQVEQYRAALAGADTLVRTEGQKIELYRAEVEGTGRAIQAKGLEIDLYKAQLDGEKAKVDIYRAQADAFGALVQGYKANVDALVAQTGLEIKVNQELPLELFKAQADGYKTVVGAEAERVKALGGIYETDGKVFDSQIKGEAARVGAEADVFKAVSDRDVKVGEIRLRAAEANVERARAGVQLLVDMIKANAQMAAQIAAASLSQYNFSYGEHLSNSRAQTESVSTSNSASTNTSVSMSVSHNTNVNKSED